MPSASRQLDQQLRPGVSKTRLTSSLHPPSGHRRGPPPPSESVLDRPLEHRAALREAEGSAARAELPEGEEASARRGSVLYEGGLEVSAVHPHPLSADLDRR